MVVDVSKNMDILFIVLTLSPAIANFKLLLLLLNIFNFS